MKRFILTTISFLTGIICLCAQPGTFKSGPVLDNPYGICSHISMESRDFRYCEANMDVMERLGIGNVRTDFDTYADFAEFNRHLSIYERVVERCRDRNLSILPIVTCHKSYSRWLKDVGTMKERFPDIRFWEVINEPDIQYALSGYPDAGEYATMFWKASRVLRRAGRSKVLTGGFADVGCEYFRNYLDKAGKGSFDILNIHIYTGRGVVPESVIPMFDALKSDMSARGLDCPVWLTETGYSTVGYGSGEEDFLNYVVPSALVRLGMKVENTPVAVIYDAEKGYYVPSDCLSAERYKDVRYVSLEGLASLNPKDVPVLIPSLDEAFPMQYAEALLSYVRRGGTVVLSGGAPLFYDYRLDEGKGKREAVGDRYYKLFHIGVLFPWTLQARQKKVPADSRYLTVENLKGKDELVCLKTDGRGVTAGLYRFNSELKGNVIANSNIAERGVSLRAQAERLPRMFLIAFSYGMEKVFWYHLRSFEYAPDDFESHFGIVHRDFTPKPSYNTYATLVKMCPDRSTRPELTVSDEGLYVCRWTKPDGKEVTAVWTPGREMAYEPVFARSAEYYDAYGRSISGTELKAGPSIIYIETSVK